MNPNAIKPWWQSTTVWAGAAQIFAQVFVVGLSAAFGADALPGDTAAVQSAFGHVVMGLLGLLAIVGRFRATKKIG